jgi:transposase-like protein
MKMGPRIQTKRISYKRRKISESIIDETQIRVENKYFWVWIAIEPTEKSILDVSLSAEETCLL